MQNNPVIFTVTICKHEQMLLYEILSTFRSNAEITLCIKQTFAFNFYMSRLLHIQTIFVPED